MSTDGKVDDKALDLSIAAWYRTEGIAGRGRTHDDALIRNLIGSRAERGQEITRLRDYWLCVDGLTFGQFVEGGMCVECGMGAAHLEATLATDDYGSCPSLPFPVEEI